MIKPIINKEDFCKIISMIEEQRKKTSDFNDALNKICDGWPVFDLDNQYLNALLLLLKKVFNIDEEDAYNTLDFYLFEHFSDDEKYMYYNNYKVNINTPELLYEVLLTEKAYKEDNNTEPTKVFFKTYGTRE